MAGRQAQCPIIPRRPDLLPMNTTRTLRPALAFVALAVTTSLAFAQAYPSKPIRMVVGYPPGGGIDFAARTVQVPMQEALKQQIVVDYKPGASGMIAATELTRQAPDGYTLLLANTGPFAIAPYLQSKPPYDPVKQFTYIGQISQGSYIAVTRPEHPAKNLKDFVAWAKAQPGQVNFASGGNGTSTHLNGELMNQVTGLDMTHVPYKGSAPAVQDLQARDWPSDAPFHGPASPEIIGASRDHMEFFTRGAA